MTHCSVQVTASDTRRRVLPERAFPRRAFGNGMSSARSTCSARLEARRRLENIRHQLTRCPSAADHLISPSVALLGLCSDLNSTYLQA